MHESCLPLFDSGTLVAGGSDSAGVLPLPPPEHCEVVGVDELVSDEDPLQDLSDDAVEDVVAAAGMLAEEVAEGEASAAGPGDQPDPQGGATTLELGGMAAPGLHAELCEELPAAGGDPAVLGDGGAPSAAPAPPAAPQITGPTQMGYFYDSATSRSIGRLSGPFGPKQNNYGVKCYLHGGKCTLAISASRVPSHEQLRTWLQEAVRPPASATKDELATMAKEHLRLLKELRDTAGQASAPSAGAASSDA